MVRALASHARGRRFESYCLYHAKGTRFRVPFLRGREGREPRAPKGKGREEKNKSRVVRARASPTPCRGDPSGVSANTYCLYHAKGTRFRVPFCVAERDENHARRRGRKKRKKTNRASFVRGRSRCLAEGTPQGCRQIPTVSPKARIRAHLALFLPDSDFGHLR